MDFSEQLKKLPDLSGVYIMRDKDDNIIYIGKAKSLKNRVRQYFQASSLSDNRVLRLVPNITRFEYIVTDTELEALILECNLIKQHKPKYNILLKDDKAYPFIKVTIAEDFPRVLKVRRHEKDKAKYYGPYSSGLAINETIDLIHKIWQLRTCNKAIKAISQQPVKNKERPCLNYDMGKCLAPCQQKVSKEQYNEMVEEVVSFLNGKHSDIIKKLEQDMFKFSENLEFEKAADLRNKITAIKKLKEEQKLQMLPNEEKDIIAVALNENKEEALVLIFFIRGGKMTGKEHFLLNISLEAMEQPLKEASEPKEIEEEIKGNVIAEFIKQFYSETTYIPKQIILQTELLDKDLISKWLSALKGQNVSLIVPKKGDKLGLVSLAAKNAQIMLEKHKDQLDREQSKTLGAVLEIQKALSLNFFLKRIEAYDISNIQGFEMVGSMVVFENGKPKPNDYRKFKIKYVNGANDFQSIEEVIIRRFLRYMNADKQQSNPIESFSNLPDIIFVDGGLGQISSVLAALNTLNIKIPVCGMVKDDKHKTKGLIFNGNEIQLSTSSEGFKLITRIQDEVHRFAITYHRKLREKTTFKSILDSIPLIGQRRKKALLKHFGSIEKIMEASVSELSSIEGMNGESALKVYNFFINQKN